MRNEIVIGELNEHALALERQFQVDTKGTQNGTPLSPSGFEDLRLIASPQGTIEAMCCVPLSTFHLEPGGELYFGNGFSTKMARLQFNSNFAIARVTTYESPFGRRMEKNWSPFYLDGKFCVVYQWNPLIVLELPPEGAPRTLKWFDFSAHLKGMRGSSQGVETENGFLFVVHERFRLGGKIRFRHRLIELGRDLQPRRASQLFGLISNHQVEYCAGLARINHRYLLSFGLADCTPFILEIPEESIERLLESFPVPLIENNAMLDAPAHVAAAMASIEFPPDIPLTLTQRFVRKIKWIAARTVSRQS
jgi:hypothetical protein